MINLKLFNQVFIIPISSTNTKFSQVNKLLHINELFIFSFFKNYVNKLSVEIIFWYFTLNKFYSTFTKLNYFAYHCFFKMNLLIYYYNSKIIYNSLNKITKFYILFILFYIYTHLSYVYKLLNVNKFEIIYDFVKRKNISRYRLLLIPKISLKTIKRKLRRGYHIKNIIRTYVDFIQKK